MNKMIAVTIRPGATTAAARLICPFACRSPPPAATRTSANVPSNSENSRRHSWLGSSKSWRFPNSSQSAWCVRGKAGPISAGSIICIFASLTAPASLRHRMPPHHPCSSQARCRSWPGCAAARASQLATRASVNSGGTGCLVTRTR